MYYRSDIFAKAGIDVKEAIKDWDSYIAAGEKLKQQNCSDCVCGGRGASDHFTTVPEGEGSTSIKRATQLSLRTLCSRL
ncbi:ABC-type sugar transport system, periplasmic component [Vibrio vulnificus]|nr:ABC-type sugar transport system, periplasmic component [Vibrio vulnificus]